MAGGFGVERVRSGKPGDPGLLAVFALLAGLGLATLWSASSGYAISIGRPSGYFALRQAMFLVPSLAVFLVFSAIPLETLRPRIGVITLLGLALLLLPFVPGLSENRNGATRWIDLRIATLQPSEFWKPIGVLYLAHFLDKRAGSGEGGETPLIAPLLITGLACLLVFLQNDFSTAAVIAVASLTVFWAACAPVGFFLAIGAAALPLAALSVLTSDFRLKRILAFIFPAYEPHGQGYQVLGSLKAIRAGGLLGKGLGLGTVKTSSVPVVQSDFVFAAWTEETGFVGVLAFFAIWAWMVWRSFRIAFAEESGFRSYLGFGLASLLALEMILNVAAAAGVIPVTGMALPFFSAGGSSLLSTAMSCGLIYNLSRSPREAGDV